MQSFLRYAILCYLLVEPSLITDFKLNAMYSEMWAILSMNK